MSGHCSCACISNTFRKYRYRIDVAIFGQYRIDVLLKLKSWYRIITAIERSGALLTIYFNS